jgi:8-oxo-dGTP pyrophosphatase MutT (NUDIX family)
MKVGSSALGRANSGGWAKSESALGPEEWSNKGQVIKVITEVFFSAGGAMTPPTIFYDRHGSVITPDAQAKIKPRRGVFALAVAGENSAVMLSAEACAPGVPELPGGGIEEGETLDQAIKREWAEEVGIPFNAVGPLGEYRHVRGFFADDRNEFWIYDQTFRLYHFLDEAQMGKKWLNSEGGTAGWEPIASLPALHINRAHWCAIPVLLSGLSRSSGLRPSCASDP